MTIKNNKVKSVVVYVRSSSINGDQLDIGMQDNALVEYAKNNNLVIIKKYTDIGVVGDRVDRPALNLLRKDLRKGISNTVLIYDYSRLARSFIVHELIKSEFSNLGVELIFINERPVSSEGDILIKKMIHTFDEYFFKKNNGLLIK